MAAYQSDGGRAFPSAKDHLIQDGMSLREYYAVRAPAPTAEQLRAQGDLDRLANPHNDPHKPPRRSMLEIEWDLRLAWAQAGIAAAARWRENGGDRART